MNWLDLHMHSNKSNDGEFTPSEILQQCFDSGLKVPNIKKVLSLAIDGVVTGEMIAEVALEDKRNEENPLLMPYFKGGKRSDNPYVNFYWDFCSQGKAAYVPMKFMTLEEAIKLITESGGLPILAHPGINIGCDKDLIESIIEVGIKGIEMYKRIIKEIS